AIRRFPPSPTLVSTCFRPLSRRYSLACDIALTNTQAGTGSLCRLLPWSHRTGLQTLDNAGGRTRTDLSEPHSSQRSRSTSGSALPDKLPCQLERGRRCLGD